VAQQTSVLVLQERLAYEQRLVQLVDRIHAAKSLDSIFLELQGDVVELLGADRMAEVIGAAPRLVGRKSGGGRKRTRGSRR